MTGVQSLARIMRHPSDYSLVVIQIPATENHHMAGRTVLDRQLGGWIMHRDQTRSFKTYWKGVVGGHVLDETEVRDSRRMHPVECGNIVERWEANDGTKVEERCAAPYPATRLPRYCGACGMPANPVHHIESEPAVGSRCPGCKATNRGGARYCVRCGTELDVDTRDPEKARQLVALLREETRRKGEPVSLGEAMTELAGTEWDPSQPTVEDGQAEQTESDEPLPVEVPEATACAHDGCFRPAVGTYCDRHEDDDATSDH